MNTKYMNPYLAGFWLGIVLLAAIFITGRGLGASGAIKSVVVSAVNAVAPAHAGGTKFYEEYRATQTATPLKTWLVFAFAGGLLFSLGAQFARGCTSGAALSGMAVLSTAGFLTMMAIFGAGYAVAFFFRRLWL